MSTIGIDIAVGFAIFALGIALTLRRFAKGEFLVLTLSALLTPVLALAAVVYVIYLIATTGNSQIGPCPLGFEEAEKIVERRRQQMFGGPLREPSMANSWRLAYQMELQRETDRVQKVARRYLVPAA
jgi:hypothetical protein